MTEVPDTNDFRHERVFKKSKFVKTQTFGTLLFVI